MSPRVSDERPAMSCAMSRSVFRPKSQDLHNTFPLTASADSFSFEA